MTSTILCDTRHSHVPMSGTGRVDATNGPQGVTAAVAYDRVSQGLEALPLLQVLMILLPLLLLRWNIAVQESPALLRETESVSLP